MRVPKGKHLPAASVLGGGVVTTSTTAIAEAVNVLGRGVRALVLLVTHLAAVHALDAGDCWRRNQSM